MRIATWNINGIKARIDALTAWLEDEQPDFVCLQEIKSVDEAFPRDGFQALGYEVATHGQKGFNGVAVLSKRPFEEVAIGLSGDEADEQARFIEVVVAGDKAPVRIAGAYMPNGNPVDTPKYAYKLAWLDRLGLWAEERLALEEPLVIAGDYNIIPEPRDCFDPSVWADDALFRTEVRERMRHVEALGFLDAVRATSDDGGIYSFWDYQGGAWNKNLGMRIDHLLTSPEATDLLAAVGIDKHVRGWEKPSDHVPVWIELNI